MLVRTRGRVDLAFAFDLFLLVAVVGDASAQGKPRARDLGVPFDGAPGSLNAITDVAGLEVGQLTLNSGEGKLVVGTGPVRTGVTVILPRGRASTDPVFAGWFPLNGNGEMTGTTWVEESGFLEGPVSITNTHSVGVVRDAVVAWMVRQPTGQPWALPVVAETYDGFLNDVNGFHVKQEHAWKALDGAKSGPVMEGNVGGGTGMICFGFKGGIGSASRVLRLNRLEFHLGVLVLADFGRAGDLRLPDGRTVAPPAEPPVAEAGSCIVVITTDVPLDARQLGRVGRRAGVGLAWCGAFWGHSSGDIALAFTTANRVPAAGRGDFVEMRVLAEGRIDRLFQAVAEATQEAVLDALVAAETMMGREGNRRVGLPEAVGC